MTRSLWAALVGLAIPAFAATSAKEVTFHKDVVPVLQKRCQGCHRPGEVAPMSFLTYNDARPWAKAIKEAVLLKKMPPWFADPAHGKFENDRSLAPAEAATLVAWAEGGAREGNPQDAPQPLVLTEGWNMGRPDTVLELPVEFAVPASGTIDYQFIVVPTGFTEDKWVQASEVRPGNRSVVHHVVVFTREPGSPFLRGAKPGVPVPNPQPVRKAQPDDGTGYFWVGAASEILSTFVPGGEIGRASCRERV